jgi:hypothetical protein
LLFNLTPAAYASLNAAAVPDVAITNGTFPG